MKARSAKNKGARFENYLQGLLRESLDINAHVNKASGAGLNKGDLRVPGFNINIEAKNAATIKLIEWWEQTKEQCYGNDTPILAIRHPKKPEFEEVIVCIEINDFMELVKRSSNGIEVIKKSDPKNEYKIRRLVDSAKEVLKIFKNE